MLQSGIATRRDSVALNIPVPLFALDGSDEHLPAYLQAADPEMVQLRTRSPLSCGRHLVTRYEHRRVELEVVACQEEGGSYLVDCKVRSSQKGKVRDDWRMAVHWPAQVEIPGFSRRHKGRVRNISLFGLGLELAFQPELDSLLLVHIKNGTSLGRVKHCRKVAHDRYWIGLYVEEFCLEEGRKSSQNLSRLLQRIVHTISGA